MTVAATNPTTTGTNTAAKDPSQALTDLTQNYTTFLQILTTQLKNQDPLNPMDSSQFTTQLVQFSSVEQQIAANKNLQTLINAQAATNAGTAVNYIGRTVAATSDQISLTNKTSTINYALDNTVTTNTITISDSKGRIVRTLTGETGQGAHTITWDGKDSSGNQLDDGVYNIAIAAANADKTAAGATIGISGTVTGVTLIDDEPMLAVGGVTVPLSKVLSVSGATSAGT